VAFPEHDGERSRIDQINLYSMAGVTNKMETKIGELHRLIVIKEQHRLLVLKLRGHDQYYGIRGNSWRDRPVPS